MRRALDSVIQEEGQRGSAGQIGQRWIGRMRNFRFQLQTSRVLVAALHHPANLNGNHHDTWQAPQHRERGNPHTPATALSPWSQPLACHFLFPQSLWETDFWCSDISSVPWSLAMVPRMPIRHPQRSREKNPFSQETSHLSSFHHHVSSASTARDTYPHRPLREQHSTSKI